MATVRPLACSPPRLYAAWISAGPYPTGVETTSGPLPFGERIALPRQCILPEVAQPRFTTPPLRSGVASAGVAAATDRGAATSERAIRDRNSRFPGGRAMLLLGRGPGVARDRRMSLVRGHPFDGCFSVQSFAHSAAYRTSATKHLPQSSYWSRQLLPKSDRSTAERELICC